MTHKTHSHILTVPKSQGQILHFCA